MSPTLIREWSIESVRRGSLPHLLRTIHLTTELPAACEDEPDDDQLLQLIEGQLTRAQLGRLEEQLQLCRYSADRVAVLRAALAEAGSRSRGGGWSGRATTSPVGGALPCALRTRNAGIITSDAKQSNLVFCVQPG